MHRRTLLSLILMTAFAASSLMLSGCGQKGPLYLPDSSQAQQEKDKEEK